jgi:rRNA maturation RNase YbeY
MPIHLKNTQRRIPINRRQIKSDIAKILNILDYSDFDIGIWITTNRTIHYYNKHYRGIDKPTDILSFPFYPNLKAGERIRPQSEDDKNLGDLIISAEYVNKQAHDLNTTFNQRMRILLVHGICHLLGYDHIKDEDYKVMHRKELFLLKKINAR